MTTHRLRSPPRLAVWLLQHLGPRYHTESLSGDLLEEYQQGRTRAWYWRQTVAAIWVGSAIGARRARDRFAGKVSLKRLLGALWLSALTAGAIAWAGNAPRNDFATSAATGGHHIDR